MQAFWPFEMSLWGYYPVNILAKFTVIEDVKWYSAKYSLCLEKDWTNESGTGWSPLSVSHP